MFSVTAFVPPGRGIEALSTEASGTGTGARVCHAVSFMLAFLESRLLGTLPIVENREKPPLLTGDTEARPSLDTGAVLV